MDDLKNTKAVCHLQSSEKKLNFKKIWPNEGYKWREGAPGQDPEGHLW